ncbi:MAG: hypothetical protein N3A65_00045 [candidate division WOR-3 bacterium]|nr:hypothetical protein [candidate division WOR-3 bacterium]
MIRRVFRPGRVYGKIKEQFLSSNLHKRFILFAVNKYTEFKCHTARGLYA